MGEGEGGGEIWVINIFGATNCERRKREATLGGGGGGIVDLISVSPHPM